MKAYCIRVGTQYVSGTSCSFGGCVPKLVSNKNFAYVYDTRAEAEAAVRQIRVAVVFWDARSEAL